MYKYEDIKMVHLEVTSRCNASCPMCARNLRGGKTNPNLVLQDMTLEDAKKIFSDAFLGQLQKIYLCGNYGDPVAGKHTLEILQYFRSKNSKLKLGIHTNGGARDRLWWQELAKVVNYCRFGIDGLADTNHLYRQGVNWDRMMSNVKTFIEAGGRAEWDYLLFHHNEHQIESARTLATELGFKNFQVKNTSRFFNGKTGLTASSYDVHDMSGNVSHELRPSSLPEYQNKALERDYHFVVKQFGSVESYWDQTEIECRVGAEKSLYVSAEGLVFPCCWTANQLYTQKMQDTQIWKIVSQTRLGMKGLSALENPLSEIIEGEFFQTLLPESWSKKSVSEGKLQVCSKTCGKCVKPFESQFVS